MGWFARGGECRPPARGVLRLAAVDAAGAAGRGESGTLRVGIVSSMAAGFLRELVRSYVERHPHVGPQISEGGLRESATLLFSGSQACSRQMHGGPPVRACFSISSELKVTLGSN